MVESEDMDNTTKLYDEDFVLWSREQAEALRAAARGASNQAIDWENVAEEIESLGISDKRELRSQICRIIEQLLKLQFSRTRDPRLGWEGSIDDARDQIERLIEDSPSLRPEVAVLISAEMRRGFRKAVRELEKHGEVDPATLNSIQTAAYTEEQILGDWFPPEAEPQSCGSE